MNVGTTGVTGTQVLLGRGTQAAPGLSFQGDPDTGLYQTTDNSLSIGIMNNKIAYLTYYNFDVKWSLRVGQSNDTVISYDGKTISGSAISTGSFGRGVIADTLEVGSTYGTSPAIKSNNGIELGAVGASNSFLSFSGNEDISIRGDGSGNLFLKANNEFLFRRNDLSGGNRLVVSSTKISGSATSTGSFGAISVKNGGSPQIFGNSNGIGIKTTDIDYPLDVQGVLRVSDAIHGFHDTTGRVYARKWIQFGPNVEHHVSATDRHIAIYADQTTNSPILKVGGGSGYTRRVGINTLTPLSTLHVKGDGLVHGDLDVTGSLTVQGNIETEGDIIAQNYIVSSSTTYMTTSFSAGSTAFGDTPSDDTHQFTGSLTVTGSSVIANSGQDPTAILSDPHNTGSYGLHVRGLNKGIRFDRYNSDGHHGAGTTMYQNGSDWTIFTQNNNDPIGDPDANSNLGIGVNRIGGNYYPQNNSIDFDGYDLKRTRLGVTHLTMGNDVTFSLAYNKSFIVSGSKIEFEPTSEVTMKGDVLPGTDNTHDLGSASKRWANIHSADLHLSNEDTEGNEVDGTTGNWTIQEGEDDLFILNKKNGKKYKFKLEEIT